MVLSASNTRRLNKLLRDRPNLSIKMINRLLRIATPRLRGMLGHLFQYFASPTCPEGGWLLANPEWPYAKYTVIFLRREAEPIRDSAVVKSLGLRIGPTSKPAELEIRDEGAALTAQEMLARGYQQQIERASREPGGHRPRDTCVRLQSVVDVDLTLQPDSYDMRFRGEGFWPALGTLRLHRLTVSAEAQLKWDVRGGKLWLYFRQGAPLSVECSCVPPQSRPRPYPRPRLHITLALALALAFSLALAPALSLACRYHELLRLRPLPLPGLSRHQAPCTDHAYAMRRPCICHAQTMRMPCIYHAYAMHMPCIYRAYAVHMPCMYRTGSLHRAHRQQPLHTLRLSHTPRTTHLLRPPHHFLPGSCLPCSAGG